MADFSKQYCDKYDPGFPHDFDILEEAAKLNPGFATPIICEGFGFIAIAKFQNGEIHLGFRDGGDHLKYVPLGNVTDQTYKNL